MPRNRTIRLATALATAAILDTAATAQDVILSEIGTGDSGAWIELHNRSTTAADVSTWALYLATATPGRPQTYWWGFRAGTIVPAGGHLLVRWLQPVPPLPVAGEVATGTSPFDFLFGLGGEPLPLDRGALALLRAQDNAAMNSPSVFADWVAWGNGGLARETIAQQAGVWVAGHATAARTTTASLARHPATAVGSSPELAWFLDSSPTPGTDNVGAAALRTLGTPCAPIGHHLLGAPALTAASTPVLGNAAFGFRITNTTGVLLEHCLLAMTTDSVAAGLAGVLPPAPGTTCLVHLDPATWFASLHQHTQLGTTALPLPLVGLPPSIAGARFYVQALVFDDSATTWPPYQGVTNAIEVTLGN